MTITLIVPIYNKAPFLRRCLDSIKNQTEAFDEVILIDDGSTDGSDRIMVEYLADMMGFGWSVIGQNNQGVSKARNAGIEHATSDFIVFLDADDALLPKASEVLHKFAERGMNIIQFGQERHHNGGIVFRKSNDQREWHTPYVPKYWQMVWNKLFKTEFLRKNDIQFNEQMGFGEDEIFNVDCLIANGGRLWHAPQVLVEHHFDDKNSICRGGKLTKKDFRKLDSELLKRAKGKWKAWLENRVAELNGSKIYHMNGVNRQGEGKHDIVYLLRDGTNEELRYSLRSVDENFAYNRVWFAGGKPEDLEPDGYMKIEQEGMDKFERVRNMLVEICKNDSITKDFWLFNDDFFVMKPTLKAVQWVNGTVEQRINQIEGLENGGMPTIYSQKLRHLLRTLKKGKMSTKNYAVHKPMLVNRKKALEVMEKYPNEPMFRALYGNYWRIKAIDDSDCKIRRCDRAMKDKQFISTEDISFNCGVVGAQLQERFKFKSRFEV